MERRWPQLRLAALLLLLLLIAAFLGAMAALTLRPPSRQTVLQTITATPGPTPTPTIAFVAAPSPTPEPTLPPLPEDLLSQRVRQQELRIQDLSSSLYVLKAAGQVQSARLALRENWLDEVDRELAAAQASLDLAATVASEGNRDAIAGFRRDISLARDALLARPDGLDSRLVVIWRGLNALLDGAP